MKCVRAESISFSNGACNRLHDIREVITPNIDTRLTKFNCDLIDVPVEQAYEEIFGESLARYNEGKRPCRQISNYLEHLREKEKEGKKNHQTNVRHPEYEYVGQIGNRESGLGFLWDEKTQKVYGNKGIYDKLNAIFKEYLQQFQERYSNLYITGFQIHWDEPNGTPHFHIRFIPVATGYKNGMEKQCSLTKALSQCGYKKADRRHEISIIDFCYDQKNLLEEIALKHDIKRSDMDNKSKHIPNGIYQQMMREKTLKEEEIKQEMAQKEQELVQKRAEIKEERETLGKLQSERIWTDSEVRKAKKEVDDKKAEVKALEDREVIVNQTLAQIRSELKVDKETLSEIKQEQIGAKNELKNIQAELDTVKNDKINLLEEYEKLKNAPPEKKYVEVQKEVELNYKEKYLEFDKSLGNVLDSIAGLDDDTFMKVINALPDEERNMFFPGIERKR